MSKHQRIVYKITLKFEISVRKNMISLLTAYFIVYILYWSIVKSR